MSTNTKLAGPADCSLEQFLDVRALRRSAACVALLAASALGGCGVNRQLPPPVAAHDAHDRHPVVLADVPHVVDVFPSASKGHSDYTTEGRVREFVARYNEIGYGQISMLAPVGAHRSSGADIVRRALANAGVRGNILVGTYPVTDTGLAAPVRLSFQAIKAKVPHRCGEWPVDLASGSSTDGWNNQTYWNFGCATQATLAAQVADPRDLAGPRGETESDIEMRMRGINKIRRGEDPTTNWRLKATSISSIGGGN